MKRKAKIVRKTKETSISVEVNLDGKGLYKVDTKIEVINSRAIFSIIWQNSGPYCNFLRNSPHNPCPLFKNTGYPI